MTALAAEGWGNNDCTNTFSFSIDFVKVNIIY
jgi:hypothetical protein